MTDGGTSTREPPFSTCCISHEFYEAAFKSPHKVAVIHASGGAKMARKFRKFHGDGNGNNRTNRFEDVSGDNSKSFDEFLAGKLFSSNPPVYEGDQCFTYSDILSATDSLSFRLRCVLDGGDDPYLTRPITGNFPGEQPLHVHMSKDSRASNPNTEKSIENQNFYTPKIVGIYIAPSVEYIVSVLSVLRCGEAFLPLDPTWPHERVLSVVSASKAHLIIGCESSIHGSHHQLDKSQWLVDSNICPVLFICLNGNIHEQHNSPQLILPCEKFQLRSFCYLMYTSGSTGKPKGVCGTEPGLLNRFHWLQALYPLHGEDFLLFKTSISFIDHLQEFLGGLLSTSTLIVPPSHELKENLFCAVDYLQAYSINRLVAVPSVIRAILPALEMLVSTKIQSSLKLIVLSGEVLHLSLSHSLAKLLPKTAVLNIYGSTEVSGDCTYFDCKRLPLILKSEAISSVPIGIPLANCSVVLVGENAPNEGEICVSGVCLASGYFSYPSTVPLDHVELPQGSGSGCSILKGKSQHYFRTGDFARQLQSGDLVFLGRKDRTIKVSGQRIAMEEVECALREHVDVDDAAVISLKGHEEIFLEAYLVTRQSEEYVSKLRSSIRSWLVSKLPLAMVPSHFIFTKSFPMSSSGKVDYTLLANSTCSSTIVCNESDDTPESDLLQVIRKAFCDALMIEKVSNNADFFEIGGNSIAAAHASYSLGIDMKLLYVFPTPLKLQMALLGKEGSFSLDAIADAHSGDLKVSEDRICSLLDYRNANDMNPRRRLFRTLSITDGDYPVKNFRFRKDFGPENVFSQKSISTCMACSFSRCNKVRHGGECGGSSFFQAEWSQRILGEEKGCMQELWKVHMESCVDASPLIVFKESDVYLFIGSHAHNFFCINAKSGLVQWECKLKGRIECSASVLDDFSQVVVGCYEGNIYFLDFLDGSICWTFQTCGEVKSQPVVDKQRHVVWCGSHDHILYALDYRENRCIYKLPCGGSIFGSPAIDELHDKLYVASTSGRVTAVSIKAFPFSELWLQELGAPIFGSLAIDYHNGNVICGLVDGRVVALDASGSVIWRGKTGGPIFAGPTVSRVLPSQVLVCSRDGILYSFELETGCMLWDYNVGDPLTSSAYVDENLQLVSDVSHLSARLVCVCTSSGSIYVLRIKLDGLGETNCYSKAVVRKFARFDLCGEIFSSPIMTGGRIFVGCRDDYVHCVGFEDELAVEP